MTRWKCGSGIRSLKLSRCRFASLRRHAIRPSKAGARLIRSILSRKKIFPAAGLLGDSVFIKAELDQTSAYPGQQVTLSYQLYTQVGINGIQIQDNPPLSGFWVEDIDVEKNPKGTLRIVNGREYRVFTIKKQALFATATGKLKIPSSTFAVSAGTGGDLFGIFGRTQTLYRKTDELFLDVKPLPIAGRPADFRNAVGSFNLTAGIDKTQAATGEAVALRRSGWREKEILR